MSSSPIIRSKDGGPPTKLEDILQLKTIWFSDVDPSLSAGADNGWYKHELVAVKKFKEMNYANNADIKLTTTPHYNTRTRCMKSYVTTFKKWPGNDVVGNTASTVGGYLMNTDVYEYQQGESRFPYNIYSRASIKGKGKSWSLSNTPTIPPLPAGYKAYYSTPDQYTLDFFPRGPNWKKWEESSAENGVLGIGYFYVDNMFTLDEFPDAPKHSEVYWPDDPYREEQVITPGWYSITRETMFGRVGSSIPTALDEPPTWILPNNQSGNNDPPKGPPPDEERIEPEHTAVLKSISTNDIKVALAQDPLIKFWNIYDVMLVAQRAKRIFQTKYSASPADQKQKKIDDKFLAVWGYPTHDKNIYGFKATKRPGTGKMKTGKKGTKKSSSLTPINKGKAPAPPPQPLAEQAILLYHLKNLSQRNRDLRAMDPSPLWNSKYNRISTIDLQEPTLKNAGPLMNLITSPRTFGFLFDKILPMHLTSMIPRIRIFKPITSGGGGERVQQDYVEYEFEEYPDFASKPNLLKSSLGTSTGAGIYSFEWSMTGQGATELEASKYIEATLRLRAQNIDELLKERTNAQGQTYSYTDIFYPRGFREQITNKAQNGKVTWSPHNFRSRILIEYAVDRSSLVWFYDPDMASQIEELQLILNVTSKTYVFDMRDDGSVNIDINFQASFDERISDPQNANILASPLSLKMVSAKAALEDERFRNKRELEQKEAATDAYAPLPAGTAGPTLDPKSQEYAKLGREIQALNKKIQPAMSDQEYLTMMTSKLSKQELYSNITKRLLVGDNFNSLEVNPCNVKKALKIIPHIAGEGSSGGPQEIQTYNQTFAVDPFPFYRKGSYQIPFLYYGDIVNAVLDNLAEGRPSNTVRTILGPLIFEDGAASATEESSVEIDEDTGKLKLQDRLNTVLECDDAPVAVKPPAGAPTDAVLPYDPNKPNPYQEKDDATKAALNRAPGAPGSALNIGDRSRAGITPEALSWEQRKESMIRHPVDPDDLSKGYYYTPDPEMAEKAWEEMKEKADVPVFGKKEGRKPAPGEPIVDREKREILYQYSQQYLADLGLDGDGKPPQPPKPSPPELDECGRPKKKLYAVNIADIPISFRLFQRWWSEKVSQKDLYTYPLKNFIADSLNSLVLGALQAPNNNVLLPTQTKELIVATFDGHVSPDTPDAFRFVDDGEQVDEKGYAAPLIKRPKEGGLLFIEDMLKNKSLPLSVNGDSKRYPGANMESYMLVFAREYDNTRIYQGKPSQYLRDTNNGVYHIHSGRDVGIVKEIKMDVMTWEEFDTHKTIEAAQNTKGEIKAVKRRYNATITLFGAPFFKPCQYIYVNPAAHGSLNTLQQMGLVGYYWVVDVSSNIEAGQYTTTLTCTFVSSGECGP